MSLKCAVFVHRYFWNRNRRLLDATEKSITSHNILVHITRRKNCKKYLIHELVIPGSHIPIM